MKKSLLYMAAAAVLSLGFTACSPDEFAGADPNQIPSMDGVDFTPAVDQETNTMVASIKEKDGCFPVWKIDGYYYSSLPTMSWSNTEAGTHTIELFMANRNGLSKGSIQKTFTFNETKVDFSPVFKRLCDKEWRIDYDEVGHMGCGEPNTDGSNWWAAGVADKKDWGVYDDRITFTETGLKGGDYTYNPGEGGTVYCNKDVATFGQFNTNDGNDYMAQVEAQNTTYTIQAGTWTDQGGNVQDCNYLVFPAGTLLPYVPNDEALNDNNRWRIEGLTASRLALVNDNGGIAWRLVFTTRPEAVAFMGFTYDQPDNLWKAATVTAGGIYYADASWAPYSVDQNEIFKVTNQSATVNLPYANKDEWQAQFPLVTDIKPGGVMSSANTYDFSCVLTSNKAQRVTLKLVETGPNSTPGSLGINYDANTVFYKNDIKLEPNVPYVFYILDQKGVDIQDNELQLMMDFGGCEEGTEVTIENIVLIDHSKNTELGNVPSDEPGEGGDVDNTPLDPASPANLWTEYNLDTWYTGGDWNGGLNPDVKAQTANEYTVVVPAGVGGEEWKGQNKLTIPVTALADKKYDFGCVFNSSEDGVITVKLADANDDSNHAFFYENSVKVTADEDITFKQLGIATDGGDYEKVMLIIDYGRLPAGTEITAKNFVFQEHQLTADEIELSWDMTGNLWAKADVTCDWWYTGGDWNGGLNPVVDESKAPRQYIVTVPDGIGGEEWKGQTKFHTNIAASADKTYNFAVTLNSDEPCTVTVKLAWEGNDNDHAFFYANDVKLDGDSDLQFKKVNVSPDVDYDKVVLFVDLGRTPAGAKVVIKDFVLVEN